MAANKQGTQGTASMHRPVGPLLGGQYSLPSAQSFAPSPPQQYGEARSIPHTNSGDVSQRSFTKINRALAPGPIAKIVIKLQQSRF